MEQATFGAGCFWGVEAAFQNVKGVVDTKVGYMGGSRQHPTYEEVCTNTTGHAEVVHLRYDPSQVTYEKLLELFWRIHDPTTLNRQGPDVGTQYRSVIFYHSPEQKEAAEAMMHRLQQSGQYQKPMVTEIKPATTFYPAEEYHQRYLEKQGRSSCRVS